jgi:hypothetical protein
MVGRSAGTGSDTILAKGLGLCWAVVERMALEIETTNVVVALRWAGRTGTGAGSASDVQRGSIWAGGGAAGWRWESPSPILRRTALW